MRPSVSQLLGWRGDGLSAAGQDLLARAVDLQRVAGDLVSVGSGMGEAWTGSAADAATGHTTRRTEEVDALAAAVHTAGQAMVSAGGQVIAAHAALQAALSAAAAAGCTVGDDGSVTPPARPGAPSGLTGPDLTTWDSEQDGVAAGHAATAGRLAAQIQAALGAAAGADGAASATLAGVHAPALSPPPSPVLMGLFGGVFGAVPVGLPAPAAPAPHSHHHHWWDSVGSAIGDAAGSAWDDVKGAGEQVWDTAAHTVTHPEDLLPLLGDGAQMTLGALMMVAAATGEAGGVVLDATGVGAVAGVPINIASAALAAGGAGLALNGAHDAGNDLNKAYSDAQADGAGSPAPSPKFETPTNPPADPPAEVPPGWRVRSMPPTSQYPDGYWKLEKPMKNGSWQPIDPSTMKPGGRAQTHVPYPAPGQH